MLAGKLVHPRGRFVEHRFDLSSSFMVDQISGISSLHIVVILKSDLGVQLTYLGLFYVGQKLELNFSF